MKITPYLLLACGALCTLAPVEAQTPANKPKADIIIEGKPRSPFLLVVHPTEPVLEVSITSPDKAVLFEQVKVVYADRTGKVEPGEPLISGQTYFMSIDGIQRFGYFRLEPARLAKLSSITVRWGDKMEVFPIPHDRLKW